MRKALKAIIAAATLKAICTTAQAVTVGLPIFTTAPGSINVVNEFTFNYPSSDYSLNYTGTIASAEGAPGFVGQTISLNVNTSRLEVSLEIGGTSFTSFGVNPINVAPPVNIECDPSGNNCTETFTGIFSAFNPVSSSFDIDLLYTISAALPRTTGYFFCLDSNPTNCTQVSDPTITELGGEPGFVVTENYIEGQLRNATITFSTVDGRPVSSVPLPATAWLLMAGIAGLGGMARRKIATAA
jgi:hypothetical protein